MEVETQLAQVDQLAALMSPLRKNGTLAAVNNARRETVSPPSSTMSMAPPVSVHSAQMSNGMSSEEQNQLQQQLSSRPPSPRMNNNMMGLILDNEASRKRCASAVTDGDRIIKSLKIETRDSQPQQSQMQQAGSNPSLIGMMPPPLQMGLNDMPPPSSIGTLSSASFMTPLTPSSSDPFFGHPPPLTPASAITGHNMFSVGSNPPSAPPSRPCSPGGRRHMQQQQQQSTSHPHSVPSMGHQLPSLANGQFTMDHRGLSWTDVHAASTASTQQSLPYSAFTNQASQGGPPQVPSFPPQASQNGINSNSNTPARPTRPSRSSSHSRAEGSNGAAAAIITSNHGSASGYATPVTTKYEEYEADFFTSGGSYPASFSMSAPHSPRSTSSDESLDWHPSMSSPNQNQAGANGMGSRSGVAGGHQPTSSIDSALSVDEFAEIKHIPNPNHPGNEIPPEFKHDVERIFFEFLNRICSNRELLLFDIPR